MALARVKTWSSGEVLTASDLNAEFNNLLNNARDLISPLTASLDMNGLELILDADADTSITADTDDRIDVRVGGVDLFVFNGTTASCVNGLTLFGTATGSNAYIQANGSDANTAITLKDANGNELLITSAVASAVNEFTVTNAATGNRPRIAASGGDTNVSLALRSKGTAEIVQEDAAGNNIGWVPRSYITGLGMANNGSDATNDIDIAVGVCRDSGNAVNIVLASALTKQLDASWAVGTNAGMRATGAAIANSTYHIFVIRRPDTGVVDIAADTSVTGANVATNTNANYTQIRRIGSIVRSGGAIFAFKQDGDKFVWTAGPFVDVNAANPGTSAVTRGLTLPIGVRFEAILNAALSTADTTAVAFRLSDLSTTDVAAVAANSQVAATYSGAGAAVSAAGECRVHTDTTAQIRSRAGFSSVNVTVLIGTTGWIDRRGRDD